MTDSLELEAVAPHLSGRFGRPYLYEQECESSRLEESAPEGAVSVCDSGAAAGAAIDCSVVLRPPPERAPRELMLVGAVGVAQAVEEATALSAQIKWPGEVMLNRREVAGVLCERRDSVVVLRIGVSVNQERGQLQAAAGQAAGSLRTLVGRVYDRAELLGSLLARLERAYDVWLQDGIRGLQTEIGPRDFLRGRLVTTGETRGIAQGIDPDGRLVVAGHAVAAGDVRYER